MKSNNSSSTFISMDKSSTLSLSFLPRHIKIEASTKQGLLLCNDVNPPKSTTPRYIICKPTTQQWQTIPNPKMRYFTRKTAMVVLGSSPLPFKIVRFSETKHPSITNKSGTFNVLRCEVFNSKTWSWKCLPENVMFPHCESLGFRRLGTTYGVLHTYTTEKRIFAFDSEKERWEIFALPYPLREDDYGDMQLVECEGRLGLICMVREKCMELRVGEDYYGQRTWTRRNQISLNEWLIREENYFFFPEALCNSDVALMKSFSKIMFYNFQASTLEDVELRKILSVCVEFFPIESD